METWELTRPLVVSMAEQLRLAEQQSCALSSRATWLQEQLGIALEQIGDLSDALRAAAHGDTLAAEAFVAGEVMGIRDLYLGTWNKRVPDGWIDTIPPGKARTISYLVSESEAPVKLRRIYIPKYVAHKIIVQGFDVGQRRLIANMPGRLFSHHCGCSVRLEEVVPERQDITIRVYNTSNHDVDFAYYLFGTRAIQHANGEP